LNRRQNYYIKLLNVYRVSDLRQIQIHAAEQLVPEPRAFDAETAFAKLKKYKGTDQILAECKLNIMV
jgi:hypothetical protein